MTPEEVLEAESWLHGIEEIDLARSELAQDGFEIIGKRSRPCALLCALDEDLTQKITLLIDEHFREWAEECRAALGELGVDVTGIIVAPDKTGSSEPSGGTSLFSLLSFPKGKGSHDPT